MLLPEAELKNNWYSFLKSILVLFSVHIVFLYFSGYFNIGLLSDDFLNFISAQSSDFADKITSSVPYYNKFHFRPLWFLSINLSIFLSSVFFPSGNNFVFFRIENLFWFYLLILISTGLLNKITGSKKPPLIFALTCLLFSNNLLNICWTAGKADLICAVFILSALSMTYKYISNVNFTNFISVLLLFSASLMTKETSVTFPLISIVFFSIFYGRSILKNIRTLLIYEFAILSAYIFLKIFIIKNSPSEVITAFQNPGIKSIFDISFKAILSLLFPFDYLTLQYGLLTGNPQLIIYLIIISALVLYILYLSIKNNEVKSIILISALFIILIIPNYIGGYFRPQLILIPFVIFNLALFIIFNKLKTDSKFLKTVLLFTFVIWIMTSFNMIKDWEYATELTKKDISIMCEKKFDLSNNKKTYIIGLPSRYNQTFLLNYVSGPYNYVCNGEFRLTDNITDIIHTGALDKNSLNSDLKINTISRNEFEIETTGTTQYLLKLDLINTEFSDNDAEIKFSGMNSFGKPTKATVKFIQNNSDVYLFRNNKLTLLNQDL
ncbi:MAG TPA: hypothetical protein PKD83_07830 [Ignavibacteria bacterium]|nr:hypothetical protein [Ignavibacteria bacterium]